MKTIITSIILNILIATSLFATGPSFIKSEMNPVAVNSRGDVLCYTRFQKNEMGAHRPMPIVYGYCILTQDTIIHYTMTVLDWDDKNENVDVWQAQYNMWQSIYNGPFKEKYILESVLEEYGFTTGGVDSYKVDKIMSLPKFNETYGINLSKTRQKALFGGISLNDYSQQQNKVRVLYNFGNIIILQNIQNENDDEYYGSYFTYINTLLGIPYEINKVTGIIFRST
ncbi:hypothetical protein [Bacteroides sp. 519]|uniref:hypothetical protein n=1 Tax=Bacteroides sp. 519 TaxID=2302937 RepID=UPI0013D4093A|nr:hypothetical protein [Bacteroides sp. 519]NDV59412.1 hypothetical protein [Bacteroides sp. 519]